MSCITKWVSCPFLTYRAVLLSAAMLLTAATAALDALAQEQAVKPWVSEIIDIDGAPFIGITSTPDSSKVYVTARVGRPLGMAVVVIDTQTDHVLARIELGREGAHSSSALEILMAPDGSRAYAMSPADRIFAIDTTADTVVGHVKFNRGRSGSDRGMAIVRDGTALYVANTYPFPKQSVTVVDTARMTVSERIRVDSQINGLVMSPLGDRLFALTTNDGGTSPLPEPVIVTEIDTRTNQVVRTIPAGRLGIRWSGGITGRVSPDGAFLYVGAATSAALSVIDLNVGKEVAQVTVPENNEHVDMTRDGRFVWSFRNPYVRDGSIDVIDTATRQIVSNIPQRGHLARFFDSSTVFTPDQRFAIIPHFLDHTIVVVDAATHDMIDTFDVVGNPTDIHFLANGKKAYVTARHGDSCCNTIDGDVVVISLEGQP